MLKKIVEDLKYVRAIKKKKFSIDEKMQDVVQKNVEKSYNVKKEVDNSKPN